jgi:hypothetical protein
MRGEKRRDDQGSVVGVEIRSSMTCVGYCLPENERCETLRRTPAPEWEEQVSRVAENTGHKAVKALAGETPTKLHSGNLKLFHCKVDRLIFA